MSAKLANDLATDEDYEPSMFTVEQRATAVENSDGSISITADEGPA